MKTVSILQKKNNNIIRRKTVMVYTGIFAVMAILIYGIFFGLNGRGLVWSADGISQHCLALAYYGEYLRTILKNIFIEHTFAIPMFDFSIGYGADIISTLHYYSIGDPLNLLAVFFDYKHIEYLYDFIIVARLYLAGLTFSGFMLTKRADCNAVCTGAIAYAFTGFSIYAGIRHPFFITGMVYCPLVLWGIDRILEKKSPILYIVSLALLVSANFYSAYMTCIFMVIYAAIVYFSFYIKNGIKHFFVTVGKFMLFTVNAMLIPMVIFLPQIYNTLAVDRLNVDNAVDLFYPPSYYASILDTVTNAQNANNWLVLGFGGVTVLCVLFAVVKAKKFKVTLISLSISIVFMMFPFFGHMLNGFTYVTNRWAWIISLIVSSTIVFAYNDMFEMTSKEKKRLVIASMVYFLSVFVVQRSRSESTMIMLAVMFACLLIVLCYEIIGINKKWAQRIVSVLVAFCAFTQAMYIYSDREESYVDQFLQTGDTYSYMVENTASNAVKQYGDDDEFYRFDTYKKYIYNASLLNDMNSTSFFFSISNPYVSQFLKEIGLNMLFEQQFDNLNNRVILQWLTGAKYRVAGAEPMKIGYYYDTGYKYSFVNKLATNSTGQNVNYVRSSTNSSTDAVNTYTLYETDYYMPMGYTYDSVMSRDEYESLTPVEKQNVLLQTAVVDGVSELKSAEIRDEDVQRFNVFDYARSTEGIVVEDNKITVTDTDAVLTFEIPMVYFSEVYAEAINFDIDFISYYDAVDDAVENGLSTIQDALGTDEQQELDVLSAKRLERAKYYYTTPATAQVLIDTGISPEKSFRYYTPENAFYSGLDTYVVNLGYTFLDSELDTNKIQLSFKDTGVYYFDEFNICYQSLENVKSDSKARTADILENVKISDSENVVTGSISLDETKILATQIPYSEGWTAYVDGVETEILNVNTMFCGLLLEPGDHEIEFRYVTPYAGVAVAASVVGVAGLVVIAIIWKRKAKNNVNVVSE